MQCECGTSHPLIITAKAADNPFQGYSFVPSHIFHKMEKKNTIHSVRKRKREEPLTPLPPLHIDNVQRVLQQAALHFVILLTAGRV